ncbi:UNKNOWN [Stylonychia lemnae]|uniref:Transmembrane protein n=1 Tax=Stylonychia lemnae TaxID=5949 RepID=A0A078AYA0_STYLE|nr:UNKNOWN [Stylonychia lemnae]|eukprot:CDW87111.1 UNKNOWN [Stylonychia lemnae]
MQAQKRKSIFGETLRALDRFGQPVTLTIDKHNQYKTKSGGVLTIVSLLIIIAYLIYNLNDVYNQKFQITSTSLLKELLRTKEIHNVQNSFDIAAQVVYTGPDSYVADNIDLYFTIYAQQLKRIGLGAHGTANFSLDYQIHFEPCKSGRFKDLDDAAEIRGINNYFMCPKNTDFSVMGDFGSIEQKMLVVIVDYCNQTFLDLQSPNSNRICKSMEEIDQIVPFTILYYHSLQSQFDQYDFSDNPLKQTLIEVPLQLISGICSAYFYKFTETKVTLKDHFLSNSLGQKDIIFYNYDQKKNDNMNFNYYPTDKTLGSAYLPNGWPLVAVLHLMDPYVKLESRIRFSITDAMSQTGGFAGTITLIFFLLSKFAKLGSYEEAMIKKLYQTKGIQKGNLIKDGAIKEDNKNRKNIIQIFNSNETGQQDPLRKLRKLDFCMNILLSNQEIQIANLAQNHYIEYDKDKKVERSISMMNSKDQSQDIKSKLKEMFVKNMPQQRHQILLTKLLELYQVTQPKELSKQGKTISSMQSALKSDKVKTFNISSRKSRQSGKLPKKPKNDSNITAVDLAKVFDIRRKLTQNMGKQKQIS